MRFGILKNQAERCKKTVFFSEQLNQKGFALFLEEEEAHLGPMSTSYHSEILERYHNSPPNEYAPAHLITYNWLRSLDINENEVETAIITIIARYSNLTEFVFKWHDSNIVTLKNDGRLVETIYQHGCHSMVTSDTGHIHSFSNPPPTQQTKTKTIKRVLQWTTQMDTYRPLCTGGRKRTRHYYQPQSGPYKKRTYGYSRHRSILCLL